jgi:hypothetical protein
MNSLGSSKAVNTICLSTSLPGAIIMFSSAILLAGILALLKRDLMVLPFASHTQQCQGFSLLAFVMQLISSLFL